MTESRTIVHLVRHGEVENPTGVLYGRLPDYHLSELGKAMAEQVATAMADRDITAVIASPLERAQETAAPIAAARGLAVDTDGRLIEPTNVFQGQSFGVGDGALRKPSSWRHLVNPFKPSWGEPYREVVVRMLAAIADARRVGRGHEVALVSHQLPIWTVRSYIEGRHLWHDPRKRQCTLASLTSLAYSDDQLTGLTYSEPAADLLPPPPGAGSARVAAGA